MNYCCFEDEFVLLIQCAYQSIGIIRYFPQENAQIKTRLAVEEEIDAALPCGYFYGVVQRDQKSWREGGFFYFLDEHWYSLIVGLGEGTNIFVELSAVRILL